MELRINYDWCREHCELLMRGYGVTPPPFRSHLFEYSEAELRAMAYHYLDLAALPWLDAQSAESQRHVARRYLAELDRRERERAEASLRQSARRLVQPLLVFDGEIETIHAPQARGGLTFA